MSRQRSFYDFTACRRCNPHLNRRHRGTESSRCSECGGTGLLYRGQQFKRGTADILNLIDNKLEVLNGSQASD